MTPTLRCSSLDRVLACPGSMALCARVAPRNGQESKEGVAIHWLGHTRMVNELGAVGNLGPTPPMPKSLSVSQWIVDYYFRTVQRIVPPGWPLEVEAALAYEFPMNAPVEMTVIDWVDGAPRVTKKLVYGFNLSGHLDCFTVNADATEAIGFDLKSGYDPVDMAESNWQVLGYALLLLKAYPSLRKITFFIVQPRNDEDEGYERVSSVTIEGDVLLGAERVLVAKVSDVLRNQMEVETGIKQCRWCAAALVCPAQIKLREQMKATLTPEYLESLKTNPDDATLVEWVKSGRSIARPIEDAADMLKDRVRAAGGVLEGVSIKPKPGRYTVTDPLAFYKASRSLLPEDEAYARTVTPSMTKLKEELATATGLPKTSKKGDSVESLFAAEFRPLCEQSISEQLVFL